MNPGGRRIASTLLRVSLIAAVFYFLGREVTGNLEQLREFQWEIQPGRLLVSVVLGSMVLLWGVAIWMILLRSCGIEVEYRQLARVWFLSNLSRYVPGMVWQFVSLGKLGAAIGLPVGLAVTSLLAQMIFMLLAAALIAILFLPLPLAGELQAGVSLLRWLTPLSLLLVHPAVIRTALRFVAMLARKPLMEWRGSWFAGIRILALCVIAWFASGLAFLLFLQALTPITGTAFLTVTAINSVAFLVGYLAFFAPGGLGFREGALAVLLSGFLPSAVAVSLSVAARLWTIAAEVTPALFLLRRTRPPVAPIRD
jgi:glycosyltransferase 2 family protein